MNVRDPKKSREYKQYVALVARQQYKGKPLDGPLDVIVDIYRPIPKSTSKVRRKKKEEKEIRPIVRPDLDNYLKAVFDGLDKITWHDDAQIVTLSANKYYSTDPRLEIDIREL